MSDDLNDYPDFDLSDPVEDRHYGHDLYDYDEGDPSDRENDSDYDEPWEDDSHLAQYDDDPSPYDGNYSED